MKIRLAALAATLCAALASCGPQGETTVGKTIAGANMRLSDWSSLPPADFLINLGDLKDVKDIRGTEHRIRDNHIAQQRARFGHEFSHGGYVYIEHLTAPRRVFSLRGTNRVNSADWALGAADKYFKQRNRTMTVGEKRHIHKYGDRGGWLVHVSSGQLGHSCLFSKLGFLSDGTKARTSGEHYDTIVHFRDCTGRRSMEEVEAFLRGLKLVSKDRA